MSYRDAQPEDRDASAKWLVEEGSPRAILGLLSRFDLNLSNQMKDRTEKEAIFGILQGLGKDRVAEPMRAWLKRAKQYAWALKLMVDLEGTDAAVRAVFELLQGDVGKATFEPERRKELLVWLAEREHADAVTVVRPFLKDFDEEVRYAAAEVLIAQPDDSAREPLAGVLTDRKEESLRLKHRIARAFVVRRWPVGELAPGAEIPDGFSVVDGRLVAS
jgi:hypothetical protein